MKILIKVLSFFLVNIIGYYASLSLFAVLVMKFDVIGYETATIDLVNFEQNYFIRIFMTWAACAIFSFASFFFKSSIRFAFLFAPIIVPLIYGLYYILSAA